MVEERHDAFGPAAVDEVLDQVAPGRRVHHVVVGQPARIVEAEAVMMARGERDVLHARLASRSGDLAAVEVLGGERVAQLVVFGLGDLLAVHDPFAASQLGIEAPVDEHAVGHPFESGDARLGHGNRITIIRGGPLVVY